MTSLRRVNVTPGGSVEMSDVTPQSSTTIASEKVEKLEKAYESLRASFPEDDPLVKHCLDDLEKARKQSNVRAHLVDEKHVTEALIQSNTYLTNTTEAFSKGDQVEQDRLTELKKAVAEQEAYMAKRAAECAAHIQHVNTTIATLEAMKVHLLAKASPTDPPAASTVPLEVPVPAVQSDTLAALHKILAETQMPVELGAQLKAKVDTLLAPQMQPSTYGKAMAAASPAAHATNNGPYHDKPPSSATVEDKDAEDKLQV